METNRNTESETLVVKPCTYHEVESLDGLNRYFWVTLYLLIDSDLITHTFLHSSDQFENMMLASEIGKPHYNTSIQVLVSHDFLPDLYRQILDYEHVLESSGIKKCKQKYTYSKH